MKVIVEKVIVELSPRISWFWCSGKRLDDQDIMSTIMELYSTGVQFIYAATLCLSFFGITYLYKGHSPFYNKSVQTQECPK